MNNDTSYQGLGRVVPRPFWPVDTARSMYFDVSSQGSKYEEIMKDSRVIESHSNDDNPFVAAKIIGKFWKTLVSQNRYGLCRYFQTACAKPIRLPISAYYVLEERGVIIGGGVSCPLLTMRAQVNFKNVFPSRSQGRGLGTGNDRYMPQKKRNP